jgi:hypothetical protein
MELGMELAMGWAFAYGDMSLDGWCLGATLVSQVGTGVKMWLPGVARGDAKYLNIKNLGGLF